MIRYSNNENMTVPRIQVTDLCTPGAILKVRVSQEIIVMLKVYDKKGILLQKQQFLFINITRVKTMSSAQSLHQAEWLPVPNAPYYYTPTSPVYPDAPVFPVRGKNPHSPLLAIKFYQGEEEAHELISDLIGQHLKNVVNFLHVHHESPRFTIMELCKLNLREKMHQEKKRKQAYETLTLARHIINGLSELKKHKIIHADVKPENIVYSQKGVAKLCDLDFSMREWETQRKKLRVGTLAYMAPEVLIEGDFSYQSDIWSLGLVLYEHYFGTFPWLKTCPTEQIANQDFIHYYKKIKRELSSVINKLNNIKQNSEDPSLAILMEIIISCLEFEPQNRKTIELLASLSQIKQEENTSACSSFQQLLDENVYASMLTHFTTLRTNIQGLPANDLFTKKLPKMSSLIERIFVYLQVQRAKDNNLLKELLILFILESRKVMDIIVSNSKRLGNQKLTSLNEKKIKLAEHLEEVNTFLESLQIQRENNILFAGETFREYSKTF